MNFLWKIFSYRQLPFYHPLSSHPLHYPILKDTWIQSLHLNMTHLPFETYKAHNTQHNKSTKTLLLRTSSRINHS